MSKVMIYFGLNRKSAILFIAILAIFLVTRFWGVDFIYHQDEYRWASVANPAFNESGTPHPPLSENLFKLTGFIFGYDYLRIVSLTFGFLNLILIYLISRKITGKSVVGLLAAGLFTVNIYSLIANLQIDIDGAILPFFVLLSFYAYSNILETPRSKRWFIVLGLAVIGGFLTKLSYLLFIGAIIAGQGLRIYNQKAGNFKKVFSQLWPWIVGFSGIAILFYYFYSTNFERVIVYAKHFNSLNFVSRAYLDLLFKVFKSFVWLSPLLTLPVTYGLFRKKFIKKYQIWFIYLFINLVFYLVIFDFSTLTIERYFMFLIIPAVLISAEVLYDLLKVTSAPRNYYIFSIAVFILLSLAVLFLPYDVLPLNPKGAYVDKVRSLNFNFLVPFSGGSGPSGFYFSALFILLSWLVAAISLAVLHFLKNQKSLFLAIFIIVGIGYNIFLDSEYLFGSFYGNVDKISRGTIEYINSNNDIKRVITYYDIGAYYLRLSGKYTSRFYTAPKRDYTEKLSRFDGHYMIVDFPAIGKNSLYWQLISRCELDRKFTNKYIDSYIFDCRAISLK